jgi:magnesium and cobalt transporter
MKTHTFLDTSKSILRNTIQRFRNFLRPEIRNSEDLIQELKQCLEKSILNFETYTILENTIQLSHLQVRDIMMPKNQMVFIYNHATYGEIIDLITQSGHSRFPVFVEHTDKVLGILHAKDLLRLSQQEKAELDLTDLIRNANFVPESKRLNSLLSDFKQRRNHMAIVVNEYGQTIGFVTLEDTIEQILGDISDEFDVDEEDPIKSLSPNHYILRADTELDIFNERLQVQWDLKEIDTIGGFITAQFGYTPQRGEELSYAQFKFKILSANSRCIKLIECIDERLDESVPPSQNETEK